MVERIRQLLNRFPEKEDVVRQLIEWNPDFNQEYEDITRKLSRLKIRMPYR